MNQTLVNGMQVRKMLRRSSGSSSEEDYVQASPVPLIAGDQTEAGSAIKAETPRVTRSGRPYGVTLPSNNTPSDVKNSISQQIADPRPRTRVDSDDGAVGGAMTQGSSADPDNVDQDPEVDRTATAGLRTPLSTPGKLHKRRNAAFPTMVSEVGSMRSKASIPVQRSHGGMRSQDHDHIEVIAESDDEDRLEGVQSRVSHDGLGAIAGGNRRTVQAESHESGGLDDLLEKLTTLIGQRLEPAHNQRTSQSGRDVRGHCDDEDQEDEALARRAEILREQAEILAAIAEQRTKDRMSQRQIATIAECQV